jgi:hypothetical protein
MAIAAKEATLQIGTPLQCFPPGANLIYKNANFLRNITAEIVY